MLNLSFVTCILAPEILSFVTLLCLCEKTYIFGGDSELRFNHKSKMYSIFFVKSLLFIVMCRQSKVFFTCGNSHAREKKHSFMLVV